MILTSVLRLTLNLCPNEQDTQLYNEHKVFEIIEYLRQCRWLSTKLDICIAEAWVSHSLSQLVYSHVAKSHEVREVVSGDGVSRLVS